MGEASRGPAAWFARGWNVYRANVATLVGSSVVLASIGVLLRLSRGTENIGLSCLSGLAAVIFLPVIWIGWYALCLKAVRGQAAGIADLVPAFRRFGDVWLTGLALFVIVIVGLILLVIPGVVFAVKYGLAVFVVLDLDRTPGDALRTSGEITEGHKRDLFVTYFVLFLANSLCSLRPPFVRPDWPLSWNSRIRPGLSPSSLLVPGLILYVLYAVLVLPWTGATVAAAYDSLIGSGHSADAGAPSSPASSV
jgi:hypothetical protein